MPSPLISSSGRVNWDYAIAMASHRHMAECSMGSSEEFRLHRDVTALKRCITGLRDAVDRSGDLEFVDGLAPDVARVRERLERSFRSPTLEYGGPLVKANKLVSHDGTVDWRKVGGLLCSFLGEV